MSARNNAVQNNFYQDDILGLAETSKVEMGWHVIWTRSNCERMVRDQLLTRNYDVFLPMVDEWSTRRGGKVAGSKAVQKTPLFRSYLFVHHGIDKAAFLDISNTRGVSRILGPRWDRLARVPGSQIEFIKRASVCDLPIMPYPYLETGARVRITRGTLSNCEGVLVRSDMNKGLFVVSVSLLQRSVAVNVDCADLEPI
jgi:transcription antitermination factor NusG